MILSSSPVVTKCNSKPKTNWPIVALLLFLAAVPGIPAILILASVAMGPPADGSAHSFVNMLHFTTPMPVIVHGGAGILFFLTMPFQFSAALRMKYKAWHRFAGGLTILSGYVIACSAPWMHQVFSPDSSLQRFSGLLIMSASMIIAFSLALSFVRGRNIEQHRVWMMRAVAITLGPITSALLTILISTIYGNLDNFYPGLTHLEFDYSRLFGMGMNLAIVEYVLFKERSVKARVESQIGIN
ncbi:MAG: hypothetical protein B0W54_12795 [Cellvibrio sp. 79]|nr:MAG: hypothetical protein B0W54_12795 [Cellvibrio sp. 79]